MLALAEKLQSSLGSMMAELEAEELGISLERYHELEQAYHDTYLVVDTLEHGYRLPKNPRKGWKSCGNY
jgi:hypothetical protein